MDEHTRHVRAFNFLMGPAGLIAWLKFNLHYEKVSVEKDKPILLLCNHNSDYDCIFAGLAAGRQIYFVATEKITRMGLLGRFVMRYFHPILHNKGMQGINTIREIYRNIRKGYSVAMFPEGNRSFNGRTCPIPPATGRMARACGATLVTYRFTGGYLSEPRWGIGTRKGRVEGHVVNVYSPAQLERMSDAELKSAIEQDLHEDAYVSQKRSEIAFRGRRRAEGLESFLFCCPACRTLRKLRTHGNRLSCECGFTAEYDEYGYLNSCNGQERYTLTELDDAQREYIVALFHDSVAKNDTEPLFADTVVRETIAADHSVEAREEVELRAYPDRFAVGDREIPFSTVEGMAINQRNLLMLHFADSSSHYECSGPVSFNAVKYLYLFRAACGSRNGVL